ncbi:MAG TPA: hypothetical protein VGH72_33800 [Pseudonocardia sp.]|jgi:hypothetical protein
MPFTRGLHAGHLASRLLSGVLLGLQLIFALLHVSTSIALRGVPVAQAQVARLTDLNWWWLFAFGMSALFLAITWFYERYRPQAHAVAGAVWAFYATELWFAAFAPSPLLPVTFPAAASVLAVIFGVVGGALAEAEDVAARGAR